MILTAFGVGSVQAANPFTHSGAFATEMVLAKQGGSKKITLERAIKKAKAKYGGKVLSAKEIRSKGPLVYKIKVLLKNGRVKTVFVDGESGEVFEA